MTDQAGPQRPGRVSLVGAGPGDPELLTLKAVRVMQEADVILHDRLIGPDILALAPAAVERIDVGKRCGNHAMKQSEINALLVRLALDGAHVVRLKGGDPSVFGRSGEELEAARAAGLEVAIVPGITAATAAAASLGLPLTERGTARTLHFASGHGAEGEHEDDDWSSLAGSGRTLALYMGARRLEAITAAMLAAGVPPDLPAMAVSDVSLPQQQVVRATVATIAERLAEATLTGPVLLIFGAIVDPARVAFQSPPTG